MRIKVLILLVCVGLLVPAKVWADVDSVSLRINAQGQITEVSTTGSDAVIIPTENVVSDEENPVEDHSSFEDSENLGDDGVDEMPNMPITNEMQVSTDNEVVPEVPSDLSDSVITELSTESVDSSVSSEDSVVVQRGGAKNVSEVNPCEAAGGSGDVDNCTCQSGGVFKLGNDNIYRCCKNNAPYIVEEGAYSATPLVPQCGCNVEHEGRRFREPYVDGAEKVCCSGKNRVWSSEMGTSGYVFEEDEVNCGCPTAAEGEAPIKEVTTDAGAFYCCRGSKYLQNKNSWQTSFLYCGCSDNIAECTTQELCEAAVNDYNKPWVWCASSQRCMLASEISGCGCAVNQQRAEDGSCLDCPSDGMIYTPEGFDEPLCCKQRMAGSGVEPAGALYDETDGSYHYNSLCGCPLAFDPTITSENAIGTVKNDTCCYNGYAFDEDANAYISPSFEVCGCPDEGVWITDTHTCCKDGKSWNDDANAYREERDVAACGCAADETSVMWQGILNCCKDGHVVQQGAYVTGEVGQLGSDAEICGCETGVWDSTISECVPCLSDSDCSAGLHCLKNAEDPSKNTCVQCFSTAECASPQVCTDDHRCAACAHGVYYEGTCVDCLQDSDCTDSSKPYCDTTTKTCEKCILHTSTVDPDKGCLPGYCVGGAQDRLCSQCIEDIHCAMPRCENGQCSNCSGSNCSCSEDSDCKPKCLQERCSNCTGSSCPVCTSDEACALPKCNQTAHQCTKLCPNGHAASADGSCPDSHCDPNSSKRVYWPAGNRCVPCYDSISEDWTDLGCPNAVDIMNYDTRSDIALNRKNICLVNNNSDQNKCVECLKDSHCPAYSVCNNKHECACISGEHYSETAKRCVECTTNYGTTGEYPCPQTNKYCHTGDYKCYQCNANYGETGSNKVACTSDKPVCNQTTHTCEACPSSKNYFPAIKQCATCGAHSTFNSSLGKCVCISGYGLVENSKQCVSTGAASVASAALNKCKTQDACQSLDVFEFTTVKDMPYTLKFAGKITVGDWAKFVCVGAILDKTKSTDTGRTQKNWCSNRDKRVDTYANDTTYCSDATVSPCKEGRGTGRECARSTLLTKDNNVQFVGDGQKCTFTVVNGNGDCTKGCTETEKDGSTDPSISVVPTLRSYVPNP